MFKFVLFGLLVASCSAADVVMSPAVQPSSICTRKNTFLTVDGSCDAYVECINFVPTHKSCPDGLHFDLTAKWPKYPCGYPSEVPCVGRGTDHLAVPTQDCPHQFGFFQPTSASLNNCGQYIMCVAGHAVQMTCPTGLAFNPSASRCDWPNNVPSCNVDAFLAYTCPAPSYDASGNPIVTNHSYAGNCYAFYSCQSGQSRLLSCDPGLAFDPASGHCIDEEQVACSTLPVLPDEATTSAAAKIVL